MVSDSRCGLRWACRTRAGAIARNAGVVAGARGAAAGRRGGHGRGGDGAGVEAVGRGVAGLDTVRLRAGGAHHARQRP